MVALYQLSEGDLMNWSTHRTIAQRAGIQEDEIFSVGQYNVEQRYCKFETMGGIDGHVSISHSGIQYAEQLIDDRRRRGLPDILSIVMFTDRELRQELEKLVSSLRRQIEEVDLDPDSRADIESDLESANDQVRAAHPNRGVIRSALERIRTNAVPVALFAATVIPAIDVVLHRLGH
jgi:hypothetical protein